MYCIICSNIISWRKVHKHELQLLYRNVQTKGAERWFFSTLRLDNCSCKSKRWLARRQILQLDLPALSRVDESRNGALCHFFPYSSHTGAFVYLEFRVLIGYWSLFPAMLAITWTYPPLVEEAGLLSTSLYQRRQRCYYSLWSSLHL